jgi:hypothetical protein
MKRLCAALLLLLASGSVPSCSQQLAWVNAPEPAFGSSFSSSSSSLGASAAVLPVRRPVAARKPDLALTDWTLLGAGAALRFLDYQSTVKCMSDPANFREVELPNALVHNRPGFGAFEAGMVVTNYYAYRFLVDRHHRKLARLGQFVNLGAMAWTVGRNYYELNEFWPRQNSLRQQLNSAGAQ